jgi:hypothetical protein
MIFILLIFLVGCTPECPPEEHIFNFTETCKESDCTYAGKCYGYDTWNECRGEGCRVPNDSTNGI